MRAFSNPSTTTFLQQGYSFRKSNEVLMPYFELINKINTLEIQPGIYTIKDGRRKAAGGPGSGNGTAGAGEGVGELELAKIMEDIVMPEFYKDIAELEGVEFM